MSVLTAEIDSKTRMKQKGTRIRSIFGVILGLAQPFPAMLQLSTIHRTDLMKQILAGIAEKIFRAQGFRPRLLQVILLRLQLTRIGRFG